MVSISWDDNSEPPPQSAVDTELQDAAGDDLHDVLRLWLSSIRPAYRRRVRGRSTLKLLDAREHGRRRA